MGVYWQQLKAMIRKNCLLKIRHPLITLAEVLLPVLVMVALMVVRMQVDIRIHPDQGYVDSGHFVSIGKGGVSPSFIEVLESLYRNGDYLAFVPYNNQTITMVELLTLKFPLLKEVSTFYKDEIDLETYIRSNVYGTCTVFKSCSYPKIKGAIVFHDQGPHLFDYSIRLNHSWAFSGFPDIKTIMDTNGPYLNDLELGVDNVPIFQYSLSGFLTLQQIIDSLIIVVSNEGGLNKFFEEITSSYTISKRHISFIQSWMKYSVSNIKLVPFPTREYTDDEFQSIIKTVMGILYLLGFLFPVSRLISYTVFEKEQKIKENLYMMGLKKGIFYVSWFLIYVFQFAVSSLIITVCTTKTLFKYSDKTVVFAYFFAFGLSAITLSFLISTFFTRAKTAVAVGTLSFLGLFFPYYTVNDVEVPMLWKVIASLLSPTAFSLGLTNFADYERAHVGLHWSNIWRGSSGVNFLVCLLMMLLDTLLYSALGFLLVKVHPENRLSYWWRFMFWKWPQRKSISLEWHASGLKHKDNRFSSGDEFVGVSGSFKSVVETISLDMKQQELDGRCIQIQNLHKVYFNRSGKCCAVNSLQLTLYENQILALLGHNGAGKSTTISMLVGLLPPTSGDAVVFGKNIIRDMEEVRNILGVCPQNDILFPELTVKEHLEIYATLKGVTEMALVGVVAEMIDQVGLTDKINTSVRALSGGMKRKLSLGIALIGNSKVIILDEPTSGMDPYSMRLTWQLIKKFKQGRIILLTTHSMDEAEVLGDRIAIMANGSLKCCGSSLFLKHHYEVGYTLTLVKAATNSSFAADIVYRYVPSAICISNVGNEVAFRLPLSSSLSFEAMFRELESQMNDKSSTSTDANNIRDISSLGIESYGISVTTLEEVFLRVAGPDVNQIGDTKDDEFLVLSDIATSDPPHGCGYDMEEPLLSETRTRHKYILFSIVAASKIFFGISVSALSCVMKFVCTRLFCSSMFTNSIFWRHFNALVTKRVISARRDMKTVVFQLGIPTVFLSFGLLFLKLKPHPDQTSLTFTTSFFNPLLSRVGGDDPIPYDMSWPISKQVASYVKGGWVQVFKPSQYRFPDPEGVLKNAVDAAGPTLGPILLSMSEFLMSSFNESYQSRYGAVVMDDEYSDGSVGYTVLHNSTCQHSAPTFINLMNSALLRRATLNDNMTIVARNHPLPMTQTQRLQHHDLDAFSAAIVVSLAFFFIPASFSVLIVKEREVKAKHQQIISGVSLFSYWTSTYAWDFISFLFPSSIAIFLFYIFGMDQFIGSDCFLPTLLLFCGYGFAVAPSTYCLTFFFCDHTKAQNVILLIHFFTGLVLMIISFIMGIIHATVHANSMLKNLFRLSPGFCFADGLASLALIRQGVKHGSSTWVFDWNITGASICYLFVEGILYFILVLVLELFPCQKLISSAIKGPLKYTAKLLHSASGISLEAFQSFSYSEICTSEPEEDVDVQLERKRVLSDSTNNPLVCLQNLRKEYSVGMHQSVKVAVHSLSFSVQKGECFGFLGTNGAGKTTTLSMLSGEEIPTSGTAYVFGNNICSNSYAARINIGYCPQFNALLEHLTVQEHLELYARIKGIPDIDNVVIQKLREFDLVKHAHKPSFSLSGGNLRKLSVAIAMIGDPPIVILDEPSTGMDPISKRFMWEVISRLSTRRGKTAVILTTHSMSEAQALCTRIGIMIEGKLRCIGSSQHLKTRFGNHLELEVKLTEVSSVEKLCEMVHDRLLGLNCNHDEICISSLNSSVEENTSISEISLSAEMIPVIANWLGNEERGKALVSLSSPVCDRLTEQLAHGGGIPLMVFAEWWLTKEKFSVMDSFVFSSFPGATFQGSNGLNVKYQLPYKGGVSLADIFGHLERNRKQVGIEEYSVGQSTLETIFNHFAAKP